MFFTPELLSKRDSGFGLLWLAATLGSRSTFKKLPKRSVLTADITQLCDLISEPAEPLALRLSSNLMFGVVRVYKALPIVKQEIFMTDVTNCVTSLKKVVQDLRSTGDGQIQMVNPVARPSALTIVPDPRAAYALDYEAFVVNWDEYLNISGDTMRLNGSDGLMDDGDDEFHPTGKAKGRTKPTPKLAPPTEVLRKENHTLEEHHEHLLSASFDLSFNHNSHGTGDLSSPQAGAAFDNFFPFSDGIDLGDGLGDDLAREMGWAVSPAKSDHNKRPVGSDNREFDFNNNDDPDLNIYFDFNAADIPMDDAPPIEQFQPAGTPGPKQTAKKAQKENNIPTARMASECTQTRAPSPATSFSRLLLSQDIDQPQPLRDITREEVNRQNQDGPLKKVKRTRLLLDARTELTDDELKIARAKYVESQNRLRQEMLNKRLEKDSGKFIDDLIWGAPRGIEAQGLKDFWQENFKVQVETKSGALRIHQEDAGPPPKRRKGNTAIAKEIHVQADNDFAVNNDLDWGMDLGNFDMDMGMIVNDQTEVQRHSSEEPGQARRISRSASVLGASNLGFDLGPRDIANGSQRSSLFPWDNAGPSSSVGNAPYQMPEGDQIVDIDVGLRGSSPSRRRSSLAPSRGGSPQAAGFGFSPAPTGRHSHIFGEDFAFDVENAPAPEDTQQDTQKSDLNLITLERNSFNFLEYAKMQYQTLSKPDGQLTFEKVVPKSTSTRHVAAAAFYHCLVLATKNLLKLEQPEPYGSVVLGII